MFAEDDGPIYKCIRNGKESENPLSEQEVSIVQRGFQVLRRVSRNISHFMHDHRSYKKFQFKGFEH